MWGSVHLRGGSKKAMTPEATIITRASRDYMQRPPPKSSKILSAVSYWNVQTGKKTGYHILELLSPVCDTLGLFLHLEVVSAKEIITSSSPTGRCQPPTAAHYIINQPSATPARHPCETTRKLHPSNLCNKSQPRAQPNMDLHQHWCTLQSWKELWARGTTEPVAPHDSVQC